jgi:hypothetical protein
LEQLQHDDNAKVLNDANAVLSYSAVCLVVDPEDPSSLDAALGFEVAISFFCLLTIDS